MKTFVCEIESSSPYSQGKFYEVPKLPKEQPDKYEERTWRNRMHSDDKGFMFIPPMAFKNCIAEAAKFISMGVPGKGKATYTKHFVSGILVTDPITLNVKTADVPGVWRHVPSNGMRGGSKRVKKCFPEIPSWKGDLTVYVLDDLITKDVFKEHLEEAGKFIGVGVFRPACNGFFGRFKVGKITETAGTPKD